MNYAVLDIVRMSKILYLPNTLNLQFCLIFFPSSSSTCWSNEGDLKKVVT